MQNYDLLNREQREAVFHTEGPLLMLAGAGSGKTKALTHRIAYLIEEKQVAPWNILAVTFTKKAAGEMKERVESMIGRDGAAVWIATFHSTCARILRRFIDRLGYETSFVIYDADDQKTLMKRLLKRMDVDTKIFKERMFLSRISRAKNALISPKQLALSAEGDFSEAKTAKVYAAYQEELQKNNALDYDDLLVKTVELFRQDKEVLTYYQDRFRYILIDEYQDTNKVQFALVSLLAEKHKNLCVVGDDDQSIYRFRGANIQNILSFESTFPDAKVIRLEENYRSTKPILDVANDVIAHNQKRRRKKLWTKQIQGEKVIYRQFRNAYEEAAFVADAIEENVYKNHASYAEHAVLYRTNAQSRLFEEKLIRAHIPYRLIGGVNFYARREIKDLLSYLRMIDNPKDDLAAIRIINVPKRGIGQTAVGRMTALSEELELSFYEVAKKAGELETLKRSAGKIGSFVCFIEELKEEAAGSSPAKVLEKVIEKTGYVEALKAEETEEAISRIENVQELLSTVISYENEEETPTLSGFLENVALISDVDTLKKSRDYVVLMTLHGAKGLEFPNVFLTGLEEGLFPGIRAIASKDTADIEEERRLFYVGATRAMKRLILTGARERLINGNYEYNEPSRFVREIKEEHLLLDGDAAFSLRTKRQEFPKEAFGASFSDGAFFQGTGHQRQKSRLPDKPYGGLKGLSLLKKGMPTISDNEPLSFAAGDAVAHVKFGKGRVKDIVKIQGDYEVTVDFSDYGEKKMRASVAKLKKI